MRNWIRGCAPPRSSPSARSPRRCWGEGAVAPPRPWRWHWPCYRLVAKGKTTVDMVGGCGCMWSIILFDGAN